ncbi:carboxypeptidase-like regulatory domain-containing protein [Halorubrum sp. CSM-61]|uniref:carboxypeptidase-like regulatory domain-containing protein n=1 Tax=Halorubrum sp. CSM-61 TaxID=2485838 RepID=UPI000F4C2EC5|nr:carboxypeptidase-like regulatory domain-containing protein [Halorubrum sp. CSM-61]
MRALPISLAVLLLLAPIAGAVSPAAVAGAVADPATVAGSAAESAAPADTGAGPSVGALGADRDPLQVDRENLTFRTLSAPSDVDTRFGSGSRGANLGSSVDFAVDETDAAMETAAAVQRIEAAETSAERQRRILAAINRVERDEVTLNSRQAEAFSAHAAGEISDRELLDELVRIAAIAREYDERLDELDALAEETDGFSSPTRLDELQVALQVYEGPVRDYALSAARGEVAATEVYIESSDRSVVLATIADGEYVREVFRLDRWDRGGGAIGNDEAIEATAAAYPETASLREPDAFGAGSVQRITIPHEFGLLRTFVSGGTGRVFVEHQRIALDAFPDTEPVSASGDGFNVTVDRSYAGGPVTVTVRDEETDEPVPDVTVTKSVGDGDSQAIGTTDADGEVRTLSPAAPYRVTVVDEPRAVFVDGLEPIATPRPAEADDGE